MQKKYFYDMATCVTILAAFHEPFPIHLYRYMDREKAAAAREGKVYWSLGSDDGGPPPPHLWAALPHVEIQPSDKLKLAEEIRRRRVEAGEDFDEDEEEEELLRTTELDEALPVSAAAAPADPRSLNPYDARDDSDDDDDDD